MNIWTPGAVKAARMCVLFQSQMLPDQHFPRQETGMTEALSRRQRTRSPLNDSSAPQP